jgi:hypothetical protein
MAVLALSAFVVAPAFAGTTSNPTWYSGGKVLGTGENLGIKSTAVGEQKLKATGIEIKCSAVAVDSAAQLLGGEPGKDTETLLYSGCKVASHETECEVKSAGKANGEIETNALTSKLAFKTKAAATNKEAKESKSVTIFTPASGTVFVSIELKGSCGFVPSSNNVNGEVIVDNVQTNEGAAAVAGTQEISATNESIYFTNPGAEEHKGVKLTAFGLPASYTGKADVESTESKTFAVEG